MSELETKNFSLSNISNIPADKVEDILSVLRECDCSFDTANSCKWKPNGNNSQVVLRTKDNYYKIYQNDKIFGWFYLEVRKAFAKVYQSLGIDWEVKEVYKGNSIYTFEKREILEVYTDKREMSNILRSYAPILQMVEKELHFDIILKQLQTHYPSVADIKLLKNNFNNEEDYAKYGEYSILLDDTDFVLVAIDKDGKAIPFEGLLEKIIYPGRFDTYIGCIKTFSGRVDKVFDSSIWLWLFTMKDSCADRMLGDVKNYKELCFQDNINILTGQIDKLEYNTPEIKQYMDAKIHSYWKTEDKSDDGIEISQLGYFDDRYENDE